MQKKYIWESSVLLPIMSNEIIDPDLDELERIFEKSIIQSIEKCRAENKGLVCTTLSGGLDSSFCLAKIREIIGPKAIIHSFTVGSNVRHHDIRFARKIAKLFKTDHHEFIPSEDVIEEAKKALSSFWPHKHHSLGDIAVYLAYKNISKFGFKCVIAHDGIDELLGGYWEHRRYDDIEKKAKAFQNLWHNLASNHLDPLVKKANLFSVSVTLPYLYSEVIKYIAKIPLDKRTTFAESKIPLRRIAEKYLPKDVITRKKLGFCSALEKR